MNIPTTLIVLLFIGVASAVDPLHCTTVPFMQTGCSRDCQGRGHISQISPHCNTGVGGICEGGHKVEVNTLYRCNIVAVQPAPNGCSSHELNASTGWKERLNNPVKKKPLCDSAGVSHHLSRTDLPCTHTGVQDKGSCTYKTMYITAHAS